MNKLTLLAILLIVFLASCAPAVPYNQMPGNDLYSSASGSRMTADALLRQAQWQEQALTQTALAPIVRITETAAALSVAQTQGAGTTTAGVQTQFASLTQTAVWFTPTPIPTATPNATQTLDAMAVAAAQTQTTLALQRQERNNEFNRLIGPFVLLVALLVIVWGMMLVTRRWRYQAAKVDARGNVIPVIDIVDGVVTDPDRNPNYSGSVSNKVLARMLAWWMEKHLGVKPLLPEITAGRQDAVTLRDQMIDLATRGLPAPSKTEDAKKAKAGEMMAQLQAPAAPRVTVIAPGQVQPILLDVVPQIAQDSIEAELYEQRKEEGTV